MKHNNRTAIEAHIEDARASLNENNVQHAIYHVCAALTLIAEDTDRALVLARSAHSGAYPQGYGR